jgi:methanethiol S-methyltransferase
MQHTGFWWILLATGFYGAFHSLLASHTAKGWAENHFGLLARRFYRLVFNLIAFIAALPLFLLAALLPDTWLYTIPTPWIFLTLVIQGIALIGLAIAVSQTGAATFLGFQQLTRPESLRSRSDPAQLNTAGFYHYVRHPIYSFTLILIWLLPVVSYNLLALMIGLTLYVWIGALLEERKLVSEFGDSYIQYRRSTPMIIPRLNNK